MTLSDAEFVLSEIGRKLLDEVTASTDDTVRWVLTLRERRGLTAEQASAIVAVASARRRARKRFPHANKLFFTDDALAQATSPLIAAYHAKGLASFGTVADLGCGIGIDAIALAQAGARVTAVEIDPVRLLFARANAEICETARNISFTLGDITDINWQADVAYWDPARREGEARFSRHAERYSPSLSFLQTLRSKVRGGAVKLSPALPDDVLHDLGARVEFLSEERECKEACVWFGETQGVGGTLPRCAVLLPEELVIPSEVEPAPVVPLGNYLFDPDPALIRASALGTVAQQEKIGLIRPEDTYLTGDTLLQQTRLASPYRVVAEMPYQPRAVQRWLQGKGVGRLVVKKRFFPKEPEVICRELGLKGKGDELTLVLIRGGKTFHAVFCERVQ
jgi:hypothetical protein